MSDPIVPAAVSLHDGALYSEQFGDIYCSVAGGAGESRHVFLAGNDLPARWREIDDFTIVETGFGAGLNFLSTWQAFRESAPAQVRLHYVSVEKHPFRADDLTRIHASWPQFATLLAALHAAYPPLVAGFHRLHFDRGRVGLTLLFGDALAQLSELNAVADAFYLDGFAPARNPEMWTSALCAQLARLAAPGATAATYSVAGAVRRALADAGFVVERRPGYARKREMLVARAPGTWRRARPAPRRVAIVGGGIAGSHCALSLARAGLEVALLEQGDRAGGGTSSNPAGLVRPFLSLDEGARAQFTGAASAYAARHYEALSRLDPQVWRGGGVLQLVRNEAHHEKLQRSLARLALPSEVARWVEQGEAAALCGARTSGPGIWFGHAGVLRGERACAAALAAAGGTVQLHAGRSVARIEHGEAGVVLFDARGHEIAAADCVVLANGHRAAAFAECAALALRPVRGQVTLIPEQNAKLKAPVCMEGYVTPALDGWHVAGGTYDEGESRPDTRRADDEANLARARRMLPGLFDSVDPGSVANWAGVRCVSRDRRPLIGPFAPGAFALLALGSRGFTWAPLAAELLAAQIAGAPLPVERSVSEGLSPRRLREHPSRA